jgi:hypothetical protein
MLISLPPALDRTFSVTQPTLHRLSLGRCSASTNILRAETSHSFTAPARAGALDFMHRKIALVPL